MTELGNPANSPVNEPSNAPSQQDVVLLVFKALVAAMTSGLGGVPLWCLGEAPSDRTMGLCIAFASGLMFGCSIVLSAEAYHMAGLTETAGAVLAGFVTVYFISRYFADQKDLSFGDLKGASASRAIVIFVSMCLHSVGEGFSIGVSAAKSHSGDSSIGFVVLLSLAIHNIPEGMAVAMVFCAQGMDVSTASIYAILCNLPQPVLAIPSFLFMHYFERWLPSGLGFAAGAMLYVVIFELLPEAREKISCTNVMAVVLLGATAASGTSFVKNYV